MKDRIEQVADILMAAAHADGHLAGAEKKTVQELLANLLGAPSVPMDLGFRLDEFNPKSFDLGEAGAAFTNATPEDKRKLLELCAAVHGADSEFDLAEDDFVRELGGAMGLDESQFEDLVAQIEETIEVA